MAEMQDGKKHETNGSKTNGSGAAQDPVALLKADHRKVEQLFEQYEKASRRTEKTRLVEQICKELIIHSMIEEEIYYPAAHEHVDDDKMDEAQVEHDGAKIFIADLLQGQPGDPYFDAKVKTLGEMIRHHIGEEENPTKGIFAQAKSAQMPMEELGQKMSQRKEQLMQMEVHQLHPTPKSFRHMNAQMQRPQKDEMNMGQGQYRDREGGSGGRGGGRYEEDDNRSQRSGQGMPERDAYGRFMREDEDRGGGRGRSRGSGRYEEDDDERGRSGWYGDPQGHSEASRLGWENREGGRAGGAERGSSGGGGGRGRGMPERDESGRFMRDDEERGGPRGGRGAGGGRGGSRYEEDDNDRSHGGWFGDPRGHSEAARRGWEHRR